MYVRCAGTGAGAQERHYHRVFTDCTKRGCWALEMGGPTLRRIFEVKLRVGCGHRDVPHAPDLSMQSVHSPWHVFAHAPSPGGVLGNQARAVAMRS